MKPIFKKEFTINCPRCKIKDSYDCKIEIYKDKPPVFKCRCNYCGLYNFGNHYYLPKEETERIIKNYEFFKQHMIKADTHNNIILEIKKLPFNAELSERYKTVEALIKQFDKFSKDNNLTCYVCGKTIYYGDFRITELDRELGGYERNYCNMECYKSDRIIKEL